ncbi:aldo/keto reductase, partial [Candidatus Micrarchaeota archaeon]|nr:aldo/keto reductase [Candidatus Micrarchaeota archaeon]
MKYRKDKYGTELSVLGYGCMRFSKKRGSIDIEKAEKEIMAAIEGGVNYFDTAYTYLGSEAALGKILADNNCRDKVYIATKLPGPVVNRAARINQIFEKQLERLRTDHID